MRFYDPMLKIVQYGISDADKKNLMLRYNLNMQRVQDDDNLLPKLLEITGLQKVFTGKQYRNPIHRNLSAD